jgi:hypothetical protein
VDRQDCCVAGFCTGRRNTWTSTCLDDLESLLCVSSRNESRAARIRPSRRSDLDADDQGEADDDPHGTGWAIAVLQEAGAIRECEYHGWMQDRADPHARERALEVARQDVPPGLSPEAAAGAVTEVLDSIGDTCPECPPEV